MRDQNRTTRFSDFLIPENGILLLVLYLFSEFPIFCQQKFRFCFHSLTPWSKSGQPKFQISTGRKSEIPKFGFQGKTEFPNFYQQKFRISGFSANLNLRFSVCRIWEIRIFWFKSKPNFPNFRFSASRNSQILVGGPKPDKPISRLPKMCTHPHN